MAVSLNQPKNTPNSVKKNTNTTIIPASVAGLGLGAAGGYYLLPEKMNAEDVYARYSVEASHSNNFMLHGAQKAKSDAIDSLEFLHTYEHKEKGFLASLKHLTQKISGMVGDTKSKKYSHELMDSIKDPLNNNRNFAQSLKNPGRMPLDQAVTGDLMQEYLTYENKTIDDVEKMISSVFGEKDELPLQKFFGKLCRSQVVKHASGPIGATTTFVVVGNIMNGIFHTANAVAAKATGGLSILIVSLLRLGPMADIRSGMADLSHKFLDREKMAQAALKAAMQQHNNEQGIAAAKLEYLRAKADSLFFKNLYEKVNENSFDGGITKKELKALISKTRKQIRETIIDELKESSKVIKDHMVEVKSLRNAGIAGGAAAVAAGLLAVLFAGTKAKDQSDNAEASNDKKENKNTRKNVNTALYAAGVLSLAGTAALASRKNIEALLKLKNTKLTAEKLMKSLKGTDYDAPVKNEKDQIIKIVSNRDFGRIEYDINPETQEVIGAKHYSGGELIAESTINPETNEVTKTTILTPDKQKVSWVASWWKRRIEKYEIETQDGVTKLTAKTKKAKYFLWRSATKFVAHQVEEIDNQTQAKTVTHYAKKHWFTKKTPVKVEEFELSAPSVDIMTGKIQPGEYHLKRVTNFQSDGVSIDSVQEFEHKPNYGARLVKESQYRTNSTIKEEREYEFNHTKEMMLNGVKSQMQKKMKNMFGGLVDFVFGTEYNQLSTRRLHRNDPNNNTIYRTYGYKGKMWSLFKSAKKATRQDFDNDGITQIGETKDCQTIGQNVSNLFKWLKRNTWDRLPKSED